MERNQLGHAPGIKFVFQHFTTISTHDTLKRFTLDFIFLSTDLLETLFALISIQFLLQNFYLIPTVAHVLAFYLFNQANHWTELFLAIKKVNYYGILV